MKLHIEKFIIWFVWLLPAKLIYYCAVRAAANATTGDYGNKTPGDVSIIDMLEAWSSGRGGDKSFRTVR